MLDAIKGIRVALSDDGDVDEWIRSRAIERGFEIISEASRHIAEPDKMSEPEIPWKQIAGIGNILRHDYDGVEIALLVETFRKDIPALEAALHRILANL